MRGTKKRLITAEDYAYLAGSKEASVAYRQLRKPLLEAFDIYKSNIAYGVCNESEAEHAEVMEWYKRLLDLDEVALTNVPQNVKQYISKEK